MATFSEKLINTRVKKGLTKADMSRKLEIPYTSYQNYENGREPKIEMIQKIAKVLEVPYTDLLEDFPMNEMEKGFLSYADEITKKRKIYDIDHRLQKLGYNLALVMDENIHTSKIYVDGISIDITDDELIALEKDSDDYLKFKLIELRNNKAHNK